MRISDWSSDVCSSDLIFLDPEGYEFDKLERTTLSKARDREYMVRADITRSFALAKGEFDVQFGGKARFRKKSYDLQLDVFDGHDDDLTLADFVGSQDYALDRTRTRLNSCHSCATRMRSS